MKILLLSTLLLTLTLPAWAVDLIPFGDKIGNGGGLWACMVGGEIKKAELVDLFEARAEFNLNVPLREDLTPFQIFEERQAWTKTNLSWLYTKLAFYFNYVNQHHSLADGILRPVDDSLYRLVPRPEECADGEWSYRQFANFTPLGSIIIEKGLWEHPAIRNIDRAALLLHEAVYFWLRREHGETDSARARHVTALLMSDLDAKIMRNRLAIGLAEMNPPYIVPNPADDVEDARGFFLKLAPGQALGILHRAQESYGQDISTKNMTAPCEIKADAVGSDRDITCVLEVEELDLYFSDLDLELNAPSQMCSYVGQMPYFFYSHQAGRGPSKVAHQELADGTIIDGPYTKNGEPVCAYDHSNSDGPNCCTGTYSHSITHMESDGTSTVTIEDRDWGGDTAACLAGPAMTSAWAEYRNMHGFPINRLEYVEGVGMLTRFTVEAAIGSTQGTRPVASNTWAANFYRPSDHSEGKPRAMLKPVGLPEAPTPKDTYEWACYDRAENTNARIRLLIREWNSGPIVEGGNPESGHNSRLDWLDFRDSFPGDRL